MITLYRIHEIPSFLSFTKHVLQFTLTEYLKYNNNRLNLSRRARQEFRRGKPQQRNGSAQLQVAGGEGEVRGTGGQGPAAGPATGTAPSAHDGLPGHQRSRDDESKSCHLSALLMQNRTSGSRISSNPDFSKHLGERPARHLPASGVRGVACCRGPHGIVASWVLHRLLCPFSS